MTTPNASGAAPAASSSAASSGGAATPAASTATPAASATSSPGTPAGGAPPPTTATAPSGQQAAPPAVPRAQQKIKTRVAGQESEMTRAEIAAWLAEHADDGELRSLHELRRGGHMRLQTAAERARQSETALARIRDPGQLMDALIEINGGNQAAIDAAIEAHYRKRVAEAEMNPDQRKAAQLEAENRRLREESERRAEADRRAEFDRIKTETRERYRREFNTAADAAGVKLTRELLEVMVPIAQRALKAGHPMSGVEVLNEARARIRQQIEEHVSGMDDDALLDFLGEERMKRIRARDVARLEQQRAAAAGTVTPPVSSPTRGADGRFASREAAQKPVSTRDWFAKNRGT